MARVRWGAASGWRPLLLTLLLCLAGKPAHRLAEAEYRGSHKPDRLEAGGEETLEAGRPLSHLPVLLQLLWQCLWVLLQVLRTSTLHAPVYLVSVHCSPAP